MANRRRDQTAETYLSFLYDLDYWERPVDVKTFICDDRYLGRATENGKTIFPCWIDALSQCFEEDSQYLVVLTGAIGTGKSTASIIGIAYVLYRLLCLKSAWGYFGKPDTGKMAVSFFNLTQTLGDSRGFAKLQSYLVKSPWFCKVAARKPRMRNFAEYLDFSSLSYVLSSPYAKGFGVVGEDVICAILDEVDSPSDSIKIKERILKAYESTVRRFISRFVIDGASIGRLFIVASAQEELSFIQTFIAKMRGAPEVRIIDIPIWEAHPKRNYSGKTFRVALSDSFHQPKILEDHEDEVEYIKQEYEILRIPVEHHAEFERDLVGALRDLAGRAVAGSRRHKLFAAKKFVSDCFNHDIQPAVSKQTITIGLKDEVELLWYIDPSRFILPVGAQRYIHQDISFTGDAMGVAMSGIKEWVEIQKEQPDGSFKKQKVPIVVTEFVLRLKAKDGDRIPLHKVRQLVITLKQAGYPIKFSADLRLASEDTTQILTKAGIPTKYVSVDKKDAPYVCWRDLVYEKRWAMYPHSYVLFEAEHLEYINGKVDHPDEVTDIQVLEDGSVKELVMKGSKDLTDAIAGSVFACISDMQAPVDTEMMKKAIDAARQAATAPSTLPTIPMKDGSGKDIVGVQNADGITKLSDAMRKLRS